MNDLLKLILIVIFLQISVFIYGQKSKKPNILIILTDDLGYGDLSCNGNIDVNTKNIDQFASKSVRIEPFYSQPVCSPSRAQLLTGRHFLKTGIWGVHGGRDYLNLDEITLSGELKNNEYNTAMIGKWHLGKGEAYLPHHRGFENTWRQIDLYNYQNPLIDNNGHHFTANGWTVDYFTDKAIDYIRSQKDSTFFLYLAYTSIHEPYHAPDSLVQKYSNKGFSKTLSTLYAMTEQLDNNIGRLMAELNQLGIEDNTLIWFLSDNGPIGNPVNMPHLTKDEMDRRNPTGMRGQKGNVSENGIHVPSFVKYGNHFKIDTLRAAVNIYDIFPTILDIADIKRIGTKPLDGISILPMLDNNSQIFPNRYMVFANHEIFWSGKTNLYSHLFNRDELSWKKADLAVTDGDFKLVRSLYDVDNGKNVALYQLSSDPKESVNIANDNPEYYFKLENYLANWWSNDVFYGSRSYQMPVFYIGYSNDSVNTVHACAPIYVHGNLITKALSIDNWNSNDDFTEYDIEIISSGDYDVFVQLKKGTKQGKLILNIGSSYLSVNVTNELQYMGKMVLNEGKNLLHVGIESANDSDETVIESLYTIIFKKK